MAKREKRQTPKVDWHAPLVEKSLTKLWRLLKRMEKVGEGGKEIIFKGADILEYREMLGYLLDCHCRIPNTKGGGE